MGAAGARLHHLPWIAKVARKDYAVGLNLTGSGVDNPDAHFYENYACDSQRNYTGYCNQEIMKLMELQSMEPDVAKRKELVWGIDRHLRKTVAVLITIVPRPALRPT